MIRNICVVENARHWKKRVPQIEFVSVNDYLFAKEWQELRQLKIINLANNYGYLGSGYYVSLVAEARGCLDAPLASRGHAPKTTADAFVGWDELSPSAQRGAAWEPRTAP